MGECCGVQDILITQFGVDGVEGETGDEPDRQDEQQELARGCALEHVGCGRQLSRDRLGGHHEVTSLVVSRAHARLRNIPA